MVAHYDVTNMIDHQILITSLLITLNDGGLKPCPPSLREAVGLWLGLGVMLFFSVVMDKQRERIN